MIIQRKTKYLKNILTGCMAFLFGLTVIGASTLPAFAAGKETGFDEYGYNYSARMFNGLADGSDKTLDGTVWGDPTYANDKLVMKWSKAWNDARFNGAPWTCDAWEDNEWNGAFPGGSGEVWHYKIVWVGPELEQSPCWKDGGYAIWGSFEVIMDHGVSGGEHIWYAHAIPNGYGVTKN